MIWKAKALILGLIFFGVGIGTIAKGLSDYQGWLGPILVGIGSFIIGEYLESALNKSKGMQK